jgi:zinc transport system substrate-binding protein
MQPDKKRRLRFLKYILKHVRILALVLSVAVTAASFSGCTGGASAGANSDGGRLKIVATVFPPYDFARQVCGGLADVTMLLPPGTESHSYEPKPSDIVAVSNCDLFIYGGGESDAWVDGVLDSVEGVNTLKMMDCVELTAEQLTEGMQEEHDHRGVAGETEYDEHVWTSPKNAVRIAQAICDRVSELDSENSEDYQSGFDAYKDELNALDRDFAEFFDSGVSKTLVFGDRFPLRYFADEYGLDCYAAFPGCSSETEPSAATLTFLIDKVKSENIKTVFYIEFSNHRIADAIAEAAGAKTALFHTCHLVSGDDMAASETYLSLMRRNLQMLREALD